MIDIFVINQVDYSLVVIGGAGALMFFVAQLALCFKAKSKWVKLIPVYILLLLLGISALIVDSAGSIINISDLVMVVILCVVLLFAISIGAAWLTYKIRMKKTADKSDI